MNYMKKLFFFCVLGLFVQGCLAQYQERPMCLAEIERANKYASPSALADSIAVHTVKVNAELPICREINQFMQETDFSDIYGAIAKSMKLPVDSLVFYPQFYGYSNSSYENGDQYLHNIRLCKREFYTKAETKKYKRVKWGGFLPRKEYFALCEKYACVALIAIFDRQGNYLKTLDLRFNFDHKDSFANIPQYPTPLFIIDTGMDFTYLYFLNEEEFICLRGGWQCWPSSFPDFIYGGVLTKLWRMIHLETQYPQEDR